LLRSDPPVVWLTRNIGLESTLSSDNSRSEDAMAMVVLGSESSGKLAALLLTTSLLSVPERLRECPVAGCCQRRLSLLALFEGEVVAVNPWCGPRSVKLGCTVSAAGVSAASAKETSRAYVMGQGKAISTPLAVFLNPATGL